MLAFPDCRVIRGNQSLPYISDSRLSKSGYALREGLSNQKATRLTRCRRNSIRDTLEITVSALCDYPIWSAWSDDQVLAERTTFHVVVMWRACSRYRETRTMDTLKERVLPLRAILAEDPPWKRTAMVTLQSRPRSWDRKYCEAGRSQLQHL